MFFSECVLSADLEITITLNIKNISKVQDKLSF